MSASSVGSGVVSSGVTIGSGGILYVLAGGTAEATALNGGIEYVSAGGLDASALVNPDVPTLGVSIGGSQVVLGGGVASAANVLGGEQDVYGHAIGAHVIGETTRSDFVYHLNGAQVVEAGGVASGTEVTASELAQATQTVLSGGVAVGTVLSAALGLAVAEQFVSAGGVAIGTVLSDGGIQAVTNGGVASATTLHGDGLMQLQAGAVVSGGITFAWGIATLEIDGTIMPAAPISGFGQSDIILLAARPASVSYDSATHVATLAGGQTITFAAATAPSALVYDPVNGNLTACFAAGTRIATANGGVAVEHLRVGERVTLAGGGVAPVVWLGHRRVDCTRHPRPWDVRPVRVAAGAFAPGLPARDLVLSPDHAVFVDGVLIPIRCLLNGATVVQEPADAVTYWHVELPTHAVLLAEGLPVESYLDTGNRAVFVGGGAGATNAAFARAVWRRHGCARLVEAGPAVTRVTRHLLRRAAALGHVTTRDPALRLLADGVALRVAGQGRRRGALLPRGTNAVRLLSRTWVPAHRRPDAPDTRVLGVGIRRLWLDGREAGLDSPALADGWHASEAGWRWTDGAASIPVRGARSLAFELAMVGDYWARPPIPEPPTYQP